MSDFNVNKKATILVLGGYGNTGRCLVPLLLEHTKADVIVAGRSIEKANAFVTTLSSDTAARVTTAQVDASDRISLLHAFEKNVTTVIVASSTSEYVNIVTEAALKAKIDYIDIHFGKDKTEYLQSMAPEIAKAGLCFITDGGFHPGLPAALVRYLAPFFNQLERANVGSVIQIDWKKCGEFMSANTAAEFAGEYANIQMLAYKNSTWKDEGLKAMFQPLEMDFGAPFGRQQCIPMFLEEMRVIPELYPSVTETGFFVGGFNWVVDYFISPIVLLAVKLFPKSAKRPMGQLLFWGLQSFSKPPYGTRLKVEASGVGKDGAPLEKTMLLSQDDAYLLTAIPVVATVMQYLSDGKSSIRKPGLWRQGLLVDPHQLLLDMQRMGVNIEPPIAS
jgi:Saccharopine dehydrogenase NADP binding domain